MADIELSNQPESHSPPASPTSAGGTVEATASDVAVDVGSSGAEEPKKPKAGKKGKKGGKKKGGGKPKVSAAAKETFNTLTEDLATILGRLRVASVVTAFIHGLVTVLLFVMGYTAEGTSPSSTNQLPGTGVKNHASPTVVVTAFGALTTCVFAFTSVWNTFHNTTKATITTRRYHTGAFMAAVIRGFFLIFFLWPGLVVFMLHSYGSNFWGSIGEVKGDRAALIAADIVVCVATAVIDVVAFSVATSRLLSFKEVDAEEEEVKDKKEAQVEGKEPVLPTQEEEERKPLGKTELGIPFLTVGLSVVLVIVLCFVAVETGFNSGTLMSVGVHLLLLLVFGYLYYKVRAGNEDNSYTKATVVRYRVFLMVHLTAVVAVFWVTFSIMLLADGGATVQDKPINKSFFETVFGIGAERTVLCIIVLLCFFGAMITYGFILFYHQRALSILDEIASLNIMERTGRGTSQVSP